MPIQTAKFIWMNGELVKWEEATMHVMTHAFLYGTSAFEGIRAYDTPHKGTCIFRNDAHADRLLYSAGLYDIPIAYSRDEIMKICRDVVRANELASAYIRVNAYLGYGELGPYSSFKQGEFNAIAFPFGAYLGEEAAKEGIDVCISSWRRVAPGTIPASAKMAGNYLSSRLISREAHRHGYKEGIGLAHDGTVSEGAGENLFVVKDGKIVTPPLAASILNGITRNTIITFAGDLGIEVSEQTIPREFLYGADEMFFTGTAAEVTRIRSLDGYKIGNDKTPVTDALRQKFFGLFNGETEDERGWLDPVG